MTETYSTHAHTTPTHNTQRQGSSRSVALLFSSLFPSSLSPSSLLLFYVLLDGPGSGGDTVHAARLYPGPHKICIDQSLDALRALLFVERHEVPVAHAIEEGEGGDVGAGAHLEEAPKGVEEKGRTGPRHT